MRGKFAFYAVIVFEGYALVFVFGEENCLFVDGELVLEVLDIYLLLSVFCGIEQTNTEIYGSDFEYLLFAGYLRLLEKWLHKRAEHPFRCNEFLHIF